ncbi:SLC13 family permease [Rhizobium sp. P40RR-XXII]|uniref:SLC13 family permease n=1 Tax=Rhizobium sp. P40RR-XXII TaxID=2726739 RepID=UPI001456C19A|nr:SLC13 family permease [Rhizobium sp. P40RR-XXII]NLS17804.1 SLC13 family permease [Rhizobium sp. P40RR-XXII]
MSIEQALAFGVIGLMMIVFIWDRFRYDIVACCALILSIAVGIVPFERAFSGFSDDIVIIVGSALVVSAGVARSGIVDSAIKRFFPNLQSLHAQLALLLIVVAVLSAFIKNIGALAIMMPVAFQFSSKIGLSPSRYLMPMSFAALIGGLMTQIGTSPNIVVSRLRHEITGTSFGMFDFTFVGATLTLVGVAFLIAFHWLVPVRENKNKALDEALEMKVYSSEATVTDESSAVGKQLADVTGLGDGDVVATAILREQLRMAPFPDASLQIGDTILLEGSPQGLDRVISGARLKPAGKTAASAKNQNDVTAIEAVIASESALRGLSVRQLALYNRRGINLLAVSRHGERLTERLGRLRLQAGDVVVLQGSRTSLPGFLQEFGCLPLAEREILLGTPRRAYIPLFILTAAMGSTAAGLVPVSIGFFAAALAMIVFRVIPLVDLYKSIDGPILIMLAALIPVSDTLRTTGGSELIAQWLGFFAAQMPPFGALALILVTAMAVTPFLNNAATVLVMAPIAASFAQALNFKPEAFLMAVAIGAGSDFLTPIGHQCNTLVMGPGGYKFADYPRLGLPLSIIIILVSVPALLYVWPIR